MRYQLYPAAVLLVGVVTAQILFSFIVYLSDISLYQNLVAIQHSGYLIVPNALVMPNLKELKPAVCGGLFFALTTGAGLSLVTFLLVSTWRSYFHEYRILAVFISIAAVLLGMKFQFDMVLTLTCLSIVAITIYATIKFYPDLKTAKRPPLFYLFVSHLVVIVLIGIAWVPVINKDMFVSIRDNLLLSNPVGKTINDFYYRYTLYPAESFKSLDQKLIKSCQINIHDRNLYDRIKHRLVIRDYLPVKSQFKSNLTINRKTDQLFFMWDGKQVYDCGVSEFLSASGKHLEEISAKTDTNRFLRNITFYSLVAASPLLCYILLHALFSLCLFFIRSDTVRLLGASGGCLMLFCMFALPFYRQPAKEIQPSELSGYLTSDHWKMRVAALKSISDHNLDISRYIDPERLADSPVVAERYWLAKSLGSSKSEKSSALISKLMNDAEPNVVCMALYSLGKTSHREATGLIINRIKTSGHWYVQWYAYKALKRLGWTQEK